MTLGNAIDEFRVGTITKYPLNYEDEVAGKGFLGVDAFTWDLEGQEGLDDAKIGGRDIWCKKSSVTTLAAGKGRYNQGAKGELLGELRSKVGMVEQGNAEGSEHQGGLDVTLSPRGSQTGVLNQTVTGKTQACRSVCSGQSWGTGNGGGRPAGRWGALTPWQGQAMKRGERMQRQKNPPHRTTHIPHLKAA